MELVRSARALCRDRLRTNILAEDMWECGVATNTGAEQAAMATAPCPNCWRLQQSADHRWIEIQELRARVMGLESVLSDYVWLVSEAAADELDPDAWNARVGEVKSRALGLLEATGPVAPVEGGVSVPDR